MKVVYNKTEDTTRNERPYEDEITMFNHLSRSNWSVSKPQSHGATVHFPIFLPSALFSRSENEIEEQCEFVCLVIVSPHDK